MIRLSILITLLLWALGAAAATEISFTGDSAEIVFDNRVTKDADFLWHVLAGPRG